jgi:hypothetical protein
VSVLLLAVRGRRIVAGDVADAFNLPDGFNSSQTTNLASDSVSMVPLSEVALAQCLPILVVNLTVDLHLLSIHNIVCELARSFAD